METQGIGQNMQIPDFSTQGMGTVSNAQPGAEEGAAVGEASAIEESQVADPLMGSGSIG
jgi:hypothetical protein